MQSLDELDAMEVVAVERSIVGMFAGLVDGIVGAVAQRKDSTDADENQEMQPVTPFMLAKLRTSELCRLVVKYKPRLDARGWTSPSIEQIEQDHRDFRRAYAGEGVFMKRFG
jgi:hypothetical protein